MNRFMLVALAAAFAGPLANAATVNNAMTAASVTHATDPARSLPNSTPQLQAEVRMLQNQVQQLQAQQQAQDNASAAQLNQIGVGG